MITQERLKELIHYDPDTGIFSWLVVRQGTSGVGSVAGSKSHGYLAIGIDGKNHSAHRLAWMYVHGYFPEHGLDHIDRVRDNNSIANLREVTQTCNMRNTGNTSANTSGVKGVHWEKTTGKWRARICVNGKLINLGRHTTFIEAACHRLSAEQAENWSGCDSSSPAYKYVMKNIRVIDIHNQGGTNGTDSE